MRLPLTPDFTADFHFRLEIPEVLENPQLADVVRRVPLTCAQGTFTFQEALRGETYGIAVSVDKVVDGPAYAE